MPGVNLKNIDLNLLVVFEAVYAAGNISHAASQLGLSQPAVSNALRRLRDLIGDPLFVRDRVGVKPTLKADSMVAPVREALGLIGRHFGAAQELDLASYRRVFRLLMIDALEPILMPPVLRLVDAKAPGISFECRPAFRTDFVTDLLSGSIDLAVYVYPVNAPQIVCVPVIYVDPVVIARKDHPAIKGKLDLATFQALGHIILTDEVRGFAHVERDLVAHRVPRRAVYSVTKLWSMPPMVQRTDLISIVPRLFAEDVAASFNLAIHEPPSPLSAQYLYMMWHARSTDDAGHAWLREALQATVAPGDRGTSPSPRRDAPPA